jgi:excinuclease ABC subunit C
MPFSMTSGVEIITHTVATLPDRPGVYRMLDVKGVVLYVGKARNLKKRVFNYTQPQRQSVRIQRVIERTAAMEIVETRTEAEALLLEANIIKRLKPIYNVQLRDDKTYPSILITRDHPFPRITKHRGAQAVKGEYFGPFASASMVNDTIAILQRAFLLRPCNDRFFANRTRACLEYQIKRCAGPCVGHINAADYALLVDQACRFLRGKSQQVQQQLAQEMDAASVAMDYERAAQLRDRIRALTSLQNQQQLQVEGLEDADLWGIARLAGQVCLQVFFFRGGQNYGNRVLFLAVDAEMAEGEVLSNAIAQFYQRVPAPSALFVSLEPDEREWLEDALSTQEGRRVTVQSPQRGAKHQALQQVIHNAREALQRKAAEEQAVQENLKALQVFCALPELPTRIEVYDNSHMMGAQAVGAMIVAGPEGFAKKAYRTFTIRETPGDDYGMMREVMRRRLAHLAVSDATAEGLSTRPNLLIMDGGAGQLSAVQSVCDELGIHIPLLAVAKGVDRNAGREQLFRPGQEPVRLPEHDGLLHYIQRLRDEAHRFAIRAHRGKRTKELTGSVLDGIPGVGATRKRQLLQHFGSPREIANATVEALMQVSGISQSLAETIKATLRG